MNESRGFTLIELIVYTAIFAIVAGILTSIFLVIINSQKKTSVSNEVTQQLNFVLVTAKRLIGDSSLVEAVYEGANPSSTCSSFCTLKLRRTDPTKDPTIISSNASGIYLQEGSSTQVTLTTNKVLVNNLRLVKHEIPGGHAVVEISTSFSYNTSNPTFALTKAIQSAIARVNAATFDADLIPNQDNTFDIGQIGSNLRWKNGRFSGDLTVAGNVGIGTTSPDVKLHVAGGIKIVDGNQGINKVLTSDANGVGSWQTAVGIPAGQVSFFDLSSCPTGWTEATAARGRYLVALPAGGTLDGIAGVTLSDLENRPVGRHTHDITDSGHSHGIRITNANGGVAGDSVYQANTGTADQPGFISSKTTGITITATGTTAGTNAPYIQYLACKKL